MGRFSKFFQIWAKIGSNFGKFWKNRVIFLKIWPTIGPISIWVGRFFFCFFGKICICMGKLSNSSPAHPYQKYPPPRLVLGPAFAGLHVEDWKCPCSLALIDRWINQHARQAERYGLLLNVTVYFWIVVLFSFGHFWHSLNWKQGYSLIEVL